jgi:hypothetical protein
MNAPEPCNCKAAAAATTRRSRGNGRSPPHHTTRSWKKLAVSRSARRRDELAPAHLLCLRIPSPRSAAALRYTRPSLRCRCRHPTRPGRRGKLGTAAPTSWRWLGQDLLFSKRKEKICLLYRFRCKRRYACVRLGRFSWDHGRSPTHLLYFYSWSCSTVLALLVQWIYTCSDFRGIY